MINFDWIRENQETLTIEDLQKKEEEIKKIIVLRTKK
jgi:hypothetical protein